MHSAEILVELVADPYYWQFLAYGIGRESVHDYLDVLLHGTYVVGQHHVERDPAAGDYACAVEQCRGHLRDGGYVQPCPFGEDGVLPGVQGGVHGVDVDRDRAVAVEVGQFLYAEGVAVPDAAAQDGGEVVAGRGVGPLVCPLVSVDCQYTGIGALGEGQTGDFDLKFGCCEVALICRVIREPGVEYDVAVGLEVPESDFGTSEVVGYGFEHDGVVLGWIIWSCWAYAVDIGRHWLLHQYASADDFRGFGVESSPVGELYAALAAAADDIHHEQLRCTALCPPCEDIGGEVVALIRDVSVGTEVGVGCGDVVVAVESACCGDHRGAGGELDVQSGDGVALVLYEVAIGYPRARDVLVAVD